VRLVVARLMVSNPFSGIELGDFLDVARLIILVLGKPPELMLGKRTVRETRIGLSRPQVLIRPMTNFGQERQQVLVAKGFLEDAAHVR
jgi:hypothetical protein